MMAWDCLVWTRLEKCEVIEFIDIYSWLLAKYGKVMCQPCPQSQRNLNSIRSIDRIAFAIGRHRFLYYIILTVGLFAQNAFLKSPFLSSQVFASQKNAVRKDHAPGNFKHWKARSLRAYWFLFLMPSTEGRSLSRIHLPVLAASKSLVILWKRTGGLWRTMEDSQVLKHETVFRSSKWLAVAAAWMARLTPAATSLSSVLPWPQSLDFCILVPTYP